MRELMVKHYCQRSYANSGFREPDVAMAMKYFDPVEPGEKNRELSHFRSLMLLKRGLKVDPSAAAHKAKVSYETAKLKERYQRLGLQKTGLGAKYLEQ